MRSSLLVFGLLLLVGAVGSRAAYAEEGDASSEFRLVDSWGSPVAAPPPPPAGAVGGVLYRAYPEDDPPMPEGPPPELLPPDGAGDEMGPPAGPTEPTMPMDQPPMPTYQPGSPTYQPGGPMLVAPPSWNVGPCAPPAACPPAPCDPCPPVTCSQARDECGWPIDWCCNPYGRTEITLEGLATLGDDPTGVFGQPAAWHGGAGQQLTWRSIDYGVRFGGRGTIAFALSTKAWLEGRAAYYGSWDESAQGSGIFGYFPGGGPVAGAFSNAATVQLNLKADLLSGEVNWRTELSCEGCSRWDLLLGVRGTRFKEIASTGNFVPNPTGFGGAANVRSSATNLFVGLQVGGVWHIDVSPRFDIALTLKGGAGNMNQKLEVTDNNIFAGGPHASSSERDTLTLMGDLELGFRFRVTPRIALTAGYQLLLIDGIVRGYDAMDFSKSRSGAVQAAHVEDSLVVHAFFAGLNFNF